MKVFDKSMGKVVLPMKKLFVEWVDKLGLTQVAKFFGTSKQRIFWIINRSTTIDDALIFICKGRKLEGKSWTNYGKKLDSLVNELEKTK